MLRIFRKSSLFYITHLITFSLFGLPLLQNRLGVIPVMALLMPLWVSSSVLFSEREESYGFLRLLPVTDGMIVRTKFTLALLAVFAYWSLMTYVTLHLCLGTDYLAPNLALINVCTVVGLLLAACWYICIWRIGTSIMVIVILAYMAMNLIGAMVLLAAAGAGAPLLADRLLLSRLLAAAPWYGHVLVLLMALAAGYGLMRLGIRVKSGNEVGT
jgi:hypothetical protein